MLRRDAAAQWGLQKASIFDSSGPQQIELGLQKLQASHPLDADAQVLLGRFHAAQLDYAQTERDYQTARVLDSGNAEARPAWAGKIRAFAAEVH